MYMYFRCIHNSYYTNVHNTRIYKIKPLAWHTVLGWDWASSFRPIFSSAMIMVVMVRVQNTNGWFYEKGCNNIIKVLHLLASVVSASTLYSGSLGFKSRQAHDFFSPSYFKCDRYMHYFPARCTELRNWATGMWGALIRWNSLSNAHSLRLGLIRVLKCNLLQVASPLIWSR